MNARSTLATAPVVTALAAPAARAAHTTIPSDHDGVAPSSPNKVGPTMHDLLQRRCPSQSAACTNALHYSTAWAVARNSL